VGISNFRSLLLSLIILFFSFQNAFSEDSPSSGVGGKNIVSLEYIPVYASFAVGGGGIGLGYEREINDWFSIHSLAVFGYFPADNGGGIILTGLSADAVFSPFSALKSLKMSSGCGFLYLGDSGEDQFGGLEGHFIIPYINASLGWRFVIGRKRVKFTIKPELVFALVLPGPTGSGVSGHLEWYSTGYLMGVLYPNLTFGVKF